MKSVKNLSLLLALAVLSAQIQADYSDDDDSSTRHQHMTPGEGLFAPFSVGVDLAFDAVTLDQTHQTRRFIDRNSSDGDTNDESMSAGEDLTYAPALIVNAPLGQSGKQVGRNRSSQSKKTTHEERHAREERGDAYTDKDSE